MPAFDPNGFPIGNGGTISSDHGAVQVTGQVFRFEDQNTRYGGEVDVKFETLFLPEIRGFSHLPDLRISMSLNADVLAQAQSLAGQSLAATLENLTQFRSDFTNMMFAWAGVENISPSSRGPFLSDARMLEFMPRDFAA